MENIRISEMTFISVIFLFSRDWNYVQYIGFAKNR